MSPKKTRRQEIVGLLKSRNWEFDDLRHHIGVAVKVLEEDLHHIQRSARGGRYRLIVSPARCELCDFEFTTKALHPPGRCPSCRERRIFGPVFHITTLEC